MRSIETAMRPRGSYGRRFPATQELMARMVPNRPNGRPVGVLDGQGYQTAQAPIGMPGSMVKNPQLSQLMRSIGPRQLSAPIAQPQGPLPNVGVPGNAGILGGYFLGRQASGNQPLPPWMQMYRGAR